jgi:hypothetical protein
VTPLICLEEIWIMMKMKSQFFKFLIASVGLTYPNLVQAGPIAIQSRRQANEILTSDPLEAERLFLISCKAGAGVSCRDYAKFIEKKGLIRDAAKHYGWACDAQVADSCLMSGLAWAKLMDANRSRRKFEQGCKLFSQRSCQLLEIRIADVIKVYDEGKLPGSGDLYASPGRGQDKAIGKTTTPAMDVGISVDAGSDNEDGFIAPNFVDPVDPERTTEEANRPLEVKPPEVTVPEVQGFDYWQQKMAAGNQMDDI